MVSRLKLGLVGAGPVVERYHLPAIRVVPEIVPWMVADVVPARRESMARCGSFRNTASDYRELIGQVDLAVVAVPNALHAPISCALLEAGIHVLCEKPLARNVAECQTMLQAAAAGGALLATGHNRRYRQNVYDAKQLLRGGMIGRVMRIEAEEGSPTDWPRSPAYFDPQVAGGGALLDVGIHAIDLVRFLVGEFTSVAYSGNNTQTEVESEAEIRFELSTGAAGEIRSSRTQRLRNQMMFCGTEGVLSMNLWGSALSLEKKAGKAFREFPRLTLLRSKRNADDSFVEQLLDFARAIKSGSPIDSDGESGMRSVEVVEWAYTGARPGLPESEPCRPLEAYDR